ncbi:MAG: M48 family metallopeptidase [Alphaproteobacteria bacterium]|nr:M48 family metallopeptidase [Alphaproteobacteria bacterium]
MAREALSRREPASLDLSGRQVQVRVRKVRGARRMTLRIDAAEDAVDLTLPRWVSVAEGLRFAESKRDWLERRLDALPPRVRFECGARVPLHGETHRIRHDASALPMVWRAGQEIRVGGPARDVAARIEAWIKAEAKRALERRAAEKAALLDLAPPAVRLRDTRSLWGSCSPAGHLSFTWRLLLAPEIVFDYVVAHEVAHLKHMNHGKRFWSLVERLTPDADGARDWLRREGARLHRYG